MAQADPQAAYAGQRPGSRRPLLRFAVIFIVVLVVVLIAVSALAPAAPAPSCPSAPAPCSVPPKPPGNGGGSTGGSTGGQTGNTTAELVVGTAWTSTRFGFSFHYDADAWNVQDDEPDLLQLKSPSDPDADREDWVIVEGAASSETTDQMIDARVASLSQSVPDLAEDTDGTYYEVKGAEIGDVPGIARVYVGTLDDTDGTPIAPVRYTIVAATSGSLTIGVTVRTLDPDAIADHGPPALTWHMLSRQLVDAILEDIRWPTAQ